MSVYLGFDPGRDKCGLAALDDQGQLLNHGVIAADQAPNIAKEWCQRYGVSLVVMGNQTTAKEWHQKLTAVLPPAMAIAFINERNSTLEARDRYWQMYPPNLFQRLLPQGMRLPPRPIDDIVAILLVERYLNPA
ncbi:pre-16S rRNA-processing nuclease YqgF [Picosynechococcus sp. PCC 73109]|uniref:pre-16S rRNA-processing nuclease YqgF n=1 Tax=Picosynechococcus sp. PCC 73109 TaxID=374982 RepID=UPI0007459029|nr:pre-16S rRNA-processing nuclease YqgF [Picosynechococcus sp. PCC 73109]AMA09365.1 resolvase [Picosynechococcus sp. PCC 73109]